jgi:autotransporter-associated beta strand protein
MPFSFFHKTSFIFLTSWIFAISGLANIPGGGTGTGANVTLVDNGNGTVTMANGIVSILITTANANITQINYTYNNGGGPQTQQLLSGGNDGGKLYWENAGFGSGNYSYSVVANNGNYCEVDLLATSTTNGTMDIHFSMLRGSPGFYVTPIWSHRAGDAVMPDNEGRDNIYIGTIFNWMSVSARHDFETGVNQPLVPAFESPQENELVTSGPMKGLYFDKYKYGEDFGGENAGEKVWGWSSVSDPAVPFTGKNIGLWHVLSSVECYNGGPMKTELMEGESQYSLNMINGSHYGLGQNFSFAANEVWSKTYGPYFIYFNAVTNTVTDAVQASRALFAPAQAHATAEATAWPYSWFTNANYASAAQRGTITGQISINDIYNPNATASNLWVGVVQEPVVGDGVYDFQEWCKAYEFWTKTDANGNFTITNIIATNNYTLYAFGPAAAGTFFSQNQTGGNPPFTYNLPATPFSVTVAAGTTTNLGAITWTPTRVGPTVFEIGYPDRTSGKFRHGDDWFVGDIGPSPTAPSPIWTKFLDYPFDFPNGVNYTVGQSHWNTDWNFIQPIVVDYTGNENPSSSTITFDLTDTPSGTASLYLGIAADYSGPIIVTVNNSNLGSGTGNASGVTATPVTQLNVNGFTPLATASDVSVREGNHGAFSDERINFPASLLKKGSNTININMRRGGYFADCAEYDYVRLELTGYVPPPPASITAYAGNNCNLICWPTTPGASSYNILRSTISGSGYISITNGVVGPVCGSGPQNATYLDASAANDTNYYYVVQSVNPIGASTNSPQSSGIISSLGISTNLPATPIVVVLSTNNSVTINWSAIPGANFYTIQRGTVVNTTLTKTTDYVPFYTTLNNTTTGTTYTDSSGTLGCSYSYIVTATSAGGTSSNSIPAMAKPIPPPPTSAPGNVRVSNSVTTTNQSPTITWSPVSGAVGYILYRATSASGPFSFPGNYVMSMTTTNYTDSNLSLNTQYYYTVVAMNAAGISANSTVVNTAPAPPANLTATPGNLQITLAWSASTGATNYIVKRGTSSGNETTTLTNTTSTTFTDAAVVNGTTYFYIVIATGPGGTSGNSSEASAIPGRIIFGARNLIWQGDGTANLWDANSSANWLSNSTATTFNNGDNVTFDDTGSNNVPVTLSGALQPALVTINAAQNYIFNGGGSISGTNQLIKNNSGALTLDETNSYTGGTIVNGGLLTFSIGAAIPASGTLTLNNTSAVTVVSANSLPNVLANGTNSITGNGNSGTGIATLNVPGSLTLFATTGSKVFDLTGTISGSGTLVLGNPSAMTLRFNGTSGDGSAIFNLGTAANFAYVRNGATAIALGGLAGGAAVILQGASSAANTVTYTIGGANANTEFDGVITNGTFAGNPAVAIVKTGAGTEIFTGANTYTGGTTINNGVLQINNFIGSGSGTGAVVVNSGGTLSGSGIISGAVVVNSGGALAPGNPLGTLTVSNNLILNSGSTTFMQIQHSPLTNSAINISGAFTAGGTLNVTNPGGVLANGDSFTLFSITNFSGAFANLILPTLTGNLVWNTNTLKNFGSLSVVTLTSPIFGSFKISGGNLIVTGSGGVNSWPYYLLASTNLASTVPWTIVATNQFDTNGNFNLTNAIDVTQPQTFYKLQLQ